MIKTMTKPITCILLFILFRLIFAANPYDEQIRKITDEEMNNYLGSICLELGGHICLTAIGHCSQCGGMTPCCNMEICDGCAAAKGVCPFCMKKLDWTRNTDPTTEVPILLAILQRSKELRPRQVAVIALTQIKQPKTIEIMMRYANEKMLSLELARAAGEFKDERYVSFLKRTLQNAANDYFGDDQDIETQYYLANAAQEAGMSLARIRTKKAVDILLNSAQRGELWERVFAIRALGNVNDKRVKPTLQNCLKEFFAKDQDWKWIPGRELIGATLQSLAQVGDKETGLLVLHYIRNPGCDFLYEELRACLSELGQPVVPEIIIAIKQDLAKNLYDWGRNILMQALGDIGDVRAIPFFLQMLDWSYPDEYLERDFKGWALTGLGKLKATNALDKIKQELFNGKEESTRQAAATALGRIGGIQAFEILVGKLEQSDAEWIERECLASLDAIAFNEIKTNEIKLRATKITAKKGGAEHAFQLMLQPVVNEEEWAIDYFFQILDQVPMQRNLYSVIELLNTKNRKVFEQSLTFLSKVTKIGAKTKFDGPPEKKHEIMQMFSNWYQQNYQQLN